MKVQYCENEKLLESGYDSTVDWLAKFVSLVYTHKELQEVGFKDFLSSSCWGADPDALREMAYKMYMGRVKYERSQSEALSRCFKMINCDADIRYWWVTLNFDPQLYTKQKFEEMIKTLNGKKWYDSYDGVVEFYGTNGFRAHFHMKITTSTNLFKKKGKVIDYLTTIIKPLGTRNSVNVVKWESYNEVYLDGLKTDSKTENVFKDKAFRESENYLERYTSRNI